MWDTERFAMSLAARDWGPECPGQDVRSATEAAGAANVVDGAPPGERGQRSNGWTTHRKQSVSKNRSRCCDQVAKRRREPTKSSAPSSPSTLSWLRVGVRHCEPPAGRRDAHEDDGILARARQVDRGVDVRVPS